MHKHVNHYVNIDGHIYSLYKFAQHYHLSYSKATRYYQQGLRDQELLDRLQQPSGVIIGDHYFKNLVAAAKYYGVPISTIYERYHSGLRNTELIGSPWHKSR